MMFRTQWYAGIAAALVLWVGPVGAQTPAAATSAELLQKAIYVEETQGQLDTAMQMYANIVRDAQSARPAVAHAYYRLGACYVKKQKQAEAKQVFDYIVVHYTDQPDIVARAREQLTAMGSPAGTGAGASPAKSESPRIVSINPTVGAQDVDPALDRLTVTFDQDMAETYSWTGGGPNFPKTRGKPSWVDRRTAVLPVILEAGKFYRLGINSTSYNGFQSVGGVPVRAVDVYFTTKGAPAAAMGQMQPPAIVSLDPPNGATDVDPGRTTMSVTFNQRMGGGMSWTGGGPSFPETTGKAQWDSSQMVCTMPVKLQPNHEYQLGINSPSFRNFKSESGISVEPTRWTFKTK